MIVIERAERIRSRFGLFGRLKIGADLSPNSHSQRIGRRESGIIPAIVDRGEHRENSLAVFELYAALGECRRAGKCHKRRTSKNQFLTGHKNRNQGSSMDRRAGLLSKSLRGSVPRVKRQLGWYVHGKLDAPRPSSVGFVH